MELNKVSNTGESLNISSNIDHLICKFCQKDLKSRAELDNHEKSHIEELPYSCNFPECNGKFSQVANLLRHKRAHNGLRPFLCNLCKKSFSSSSNLKQHIEAHKNQLTRSKFVCFVGDCSKSYLYVCTLKKHIQTTHQKEYNEIVSVYGEDINFISVYKDLLKNAERFSFIEIKQMSLSNNEKSCEISTSENSKPCPNEGIVDLKTVKEEVKGYLTSSMNGLKQYFDLLTNQFVHKSVSSGLGNQLIMNPSILPNFNDLLGQINSQNIQQINLSKVLSILNALPQNSNLTLKELGSIVTASGGSKFLLKIDLPSS